MTSLKQQHVPKFLRCFFLFFATLKVTLTVAEVYYESCVAVRSGKKSPNQETGLGNRGHLKVLNDTKFILNDQAGPSCFLGLIWYQLEPSDLLYFTNQFLGWDFFCRFLQQECSTYNNALRCFQ